MKPVNIIKEVHRNSMKYMLQINSVVKLSLDKLLSNNYKENK